MEERIARCDINQSRIIRCHANLACDVEMRQYFGGEAYDADRVRHCVITQSGPTGWHSAAASAPPTTFKNATDLAREAVGCNHPSRRAVTSHQRNPLAAGAHPLVSYHSDQQLRPPRQLEPASPCCNLVPTHPRRAHWWQLVLHRPTDPDHQTGALRCRGWSPSSPSIRTGVVYASTKSHPRHLSD